MPLQRCHKVLFQGIWPKKSNFWINRLEKQKPKIVVVVVTSSHFTALGDWLHCNIMRFGPKMIIISCCSCMLHVVHAATMAVQFQL